MDESVDTKQNRLASSRSVVRWGLLGGVVAVIVFLLVLSVYVWTMSPRDTGGLGGGFFASWVTFIFLYGLLPVFALGAAVGAVAARKSPKVAALAVGTLGLSGLVFGSVTIAVIQRPRVEMITIVRTDSGDVLFFRRYGKLENSFTKKHGEGGMVFSRDDVNPPITSATIKWPRAGEFEVTLEFAGRHKS